MWFRERPAADVDWFNKFRDMADLDWYRQESWNHEAASNFEMRLSRARGQRGEYLRIQALTLADTNRTENAGPAIQLAKRHLEQQPEGISAAQMHQ
jgi:hypothetical protein